MTLTLAADALNIDLDDRAQVGVSDETREALISLGWTPPDAGAPDVRGLFHLAGDEDGGGALACRECDEGGSATARFTDDGFPALTAVNNAAEQHARQCHPGLQIGTGVPDSGPVPAAPDLEPCSDGARVYQTE